MSLVSSRHFSWISRIIKHQVIDLTCELPITEAMANIDMANVTFSFDKCTPQTQDWEFLHTRKQGLSFVWMCIRNIHYNYMETSIIWAILQHQFAIWSYSLIAYLCAASILIPQTNHSHPLTALGSCRLIVWGFYKSCLFYRHILCEISILFFKLKLKILQFVLNRLLFVMWN